MTRPVAVVGTGRMGAAMVERLAAAGCHVVAYNRTRAAAEATGAQVAGTAREAAAGAGIVLVSLADDAACLDAYAGQDGLAAGVGPESVVVETSTVAPETARKLAALVRDRSGLYLDAPVSGSVPSVRAGELTFLAGGEQAALDRARPVLERLSRHIIHLGAVGVGSVMKLAINSVVFGLNEAVAEALVLAERAGVQRSAAYEALAASAVAAPYVHYKREAFERPESAAVAFRLALVAKDLGLVEELAKFTGTRMVLADANRALVAEALEQGMGERDISAVADLLRRTSHHDPT